MAKRKKQVGGSCVEPNMTPMIDCTFQLIIFFILTAQMASEDLAKLAVSKPYHSMAKGADKKGGQPDINDLTKVTVNVVNEYGDETKDRDPGRSAHAKRYKVGMDEIEVGDVERLSEIMKGRKQSATEAKKIKPEDFFVEIRADMDVSFEDIKPVMEAAAAAKIVKMTITALVDKDVDVK